MPTAREIDDNGFLLVKDCPISSFGIFDYSAAQLGLPGDPNRIVKVYRPESAVNDPETIESFKNVPFIVDHEMLSGFVDDDDENGTSAPEEKGIDGVLTSNVYYAAPWMRGDLKIFSRKAQRALAKRKKDLSLGYTCDFEQKPGVFDGQPYEVVQVNLRGNHIALVDEGRVPGARVLDGMCFDHLNFEVRPSDEDSQMKNGKRGTVAKDNAVEQLQALIPALQKFLQQEQQEPEHQVESNADNEGTEGTEAGAGNEGQETNEGEAGGDVNQLIAQVEAVLSQLKAKVGNGGNEGNGNEGSEGADESERLAAEREREGERREGADELEGLNGKAGDAEIENTATENEGKAEENNGKASKGPSAGTPSMAGDAALRRFYADAADKSRLYNRLSPVVGAFDHARMDAREVAAYGVKKLGLKAPKGGEYIALDSYLTGVEAANKKHRTSVQGQRRSTGDSAVVHSSDDMDAYLTGSK